VAASQGGATWNCPSCSYQNPASAAACEMCRAAKEESVRVHVQNDGQKDTLNQAKQSASAAAQQAGVALKAGFTFAKGWVNSKTAAQNNQGSNNQS